MPMLTHASDTVKKPSRAEHRSLLRLAAERFGQNSLALIGLGIMLAFIVMAVCAPLLAPYDPIGLNVKSRLLAPSTTHLFGTDALGRDVLSRVIWGGRISLWVGIASVLLGLSMGVTLGLFAGYIGGITEAIIMRGMDLILSFPGIILAIWLVSMLGPGVNQVILANALFFLPEFSRIVRGNVMSIKESGYITASKALGGKNLHVMFAHILPNVLAPIIVVSSMSLSGAVLSGAGLSFLGLGAQPPTPEWGAILSDGRSFIRTAWWLVLFPGLFISLFVLASNIVGDGMRDALDPRFTKGTE